MKSLLALLAVLATTVVSAQALEKQDKTLNPYLPYAGAPIASFRLPKLVRWEVVGRYSVVVWPRVSDAYLLTVEPPCFDLGTTHELALSSKAEIVSRLFDSVLIRRGKCQINEIRPVDYKKYQADQKEVKAEGKG